VVAIDPGDPGEEPWMTKQTELHEMEELKTIGWIHTHPSFTCFFSNVDSHSNALH
jgi:proteasome lid subunit RPN8/RPN11